MMNHDATHCLDWTQDCPNECYRAMITADLHSLRGHRIIASWANFAGTEECIKDKSQNGVQDAGEFDL